MIKTETFDSIGPISLKIEAPGHLISINNDESSSNEDSDSDSSENDGSDSEGEIYAAPKDLRDEFDEKLLEKQDSTSKSTTELRARANQTVIDWLSNNFERADGISFPKDLMFEQFCLYAKENCPEAVKFFNVNQIGWINFKKLVHLTFNKIEIRRYGNDKKRHYYGIRLKPESTLHEKNLPGLSPNIGGYLIGGMRSTSECGWQNTIKIINSNMQNKDLTSPAIRGPPLGCQNKKIIKIAENNPTVIDWLSKNFEKQDGMVFLPKNSVFQEYCYYAKENNLLSVNKYTFGQLLGFVFDGVKTKRLGIKGNYSNHYCGIQIKQNSSLHEKNQHLTSQAISGGVHERLSNANPEIKEWLLNNFERAEVDERSDGISFPKTAMFKHYCRFAEENCFVPVGNVVFGKIVRVVFGELKTRGLGPNNNRKTYYYGIQLKPDSALHKKKSCGFLPTTSGGVFGQRKLKMITKPKIYECKFCPKTFSRIDNLTFHTRTVHFKEKPYACKYDCGLKFSNRNERWRHEQKHHEVQENKKKRKRSED